MSLNNSSIAHSAPQYSRPSSHYYSSYPAQTSSYPYPSPTISHVKLELPSQQTTRRPSYPYPARSSSQLSSPQMHSIKAENHYILPSPTEALKVKSPSPAPHSSVSLPSFSEFFGNLPPVPSSMPSQSSHSSLPPLLLPNKAPSQHPSKRPRRKYHQIDRNYSCKFPGCDKSYGALNHLNAHIKSKGHGEKRSPMEFIEIRRALSNLTGN
jgi:hypothetical protein